MQIIGDNICQVHGIVKRKTSRTFTKASPKKGKDETPGDAKGRTH